MAPSLATIPDTCSLPRTCQSVPPSNLFVDDVVAVLRGMLVLFCSPSLHPKLLPASLQVDVHFIDRDLRVDLDGIQVNAQYRQ